LPDVSLDRLTDTMRVFGLDFTSAPRRSKPLVLAVCQCTRRVLDLQELRPLLGRRDQPFRQFTEWLQSSGPWIAGLDFPFGLPRALIEEVDWGKTWSGYVGHVAALGKAAYEAALRAYKAGKPPGAKELLRFTDRKAKARSPMKLENPPVGKMFFAGATRLWHAPVSILPVRPRAHETRFVVEAYPAMVIRKCIGRNHRYKHDDVRKCTADMRQARRDIVRAICGKAIKERYGLTVRMSERDMQACSNDHSGDHLDSVLCAIQAAWAHGRRATGYGIPREADALEGWIVDPEML
jgi:hypothetical protein